jgi:hypothetical protein
MATTTNYSWSTPDDTALVKDGAAAIRSLGTAIDTTVFTNAGAAINKSIVDAKGDLIAATGADAVTRVAVGTNGQYLKADSTASGGVAWDTLPASGGLTLISETVASANSSINLTSIPGTYKQLMVVWSGLNPSNGTTNFAFRFNNDSTANIYEAVYSGAGTTSIAGISADSADDGGATGFAMFGYSAHSSSTDYQMQSKGVILIDNYASTSKYKFYDGKSSWRANGSIYRFPVVNGVYKSTSAITSFDIVRISGAGTLTNATSTSIRLYGLS